MHRRQLAITQSLQELDDLQVRPLFRVGREFLSAYAVEERVVEAVECDHVGDLAGQQTGMVFVENDPAPIEDYLENASRISQGFNLRMIDLVCDAHGSVLLQVFAHTRELTDHGNAERLKLFLWTNA